MGVMAAGNVLTTLGVLKGYYLGECLRLGSYREAKNLSWAY